MPDADFFRDKADHCRKIAKIVRSPVLRSELMEFAEEFELKARELDPQAAAGEPTPSR